MDGGEDGGDGFGRDVVAFAPCLAAMENLFEAFGLQGLHMVAVFPFADLFADAKPLENSVPDTVVEFVYLGAKPLQAGIVRLRRKNDRQESGHLFRRQLLRSIGERLCGVGMYLNHRAVES